MTRLTLQNPLVTMRQLKETPSSKNGIDSETEEKLRILACTIIQCVGIHLKTSQKTIACASVLLQRFYYVCSMREYALDTIIMGALYLAGKLEETPMSYNSIIMGVDFVVKTLRNKKDFLETPHNMEGILMKNGVLSGEMFLLRELGFNVRVQLPYVLVINYIQILSLQDNKELLQKAWNYLNDSLKTIIYVCYDPSSIACAAIELTCREFDIALPTKPEWYEVFEARKEDVDIIMEHMKRVYTIKVDYFLPIFMKEMNEFMRKRYR